MSIPLDTDSFMGYNRIVTKYGTGGMAMKRLKSVHPSGIFGLARDIDGHQFKPDAKPNPDQKPCARCGRHEGVAWIAGAGEYLCYRHQDDY